MNSKKDTAVTKSTFSAEDDFAKLSKENKSLVGANDDSAQMPSTTNPAKSSQVYDSSQQSSLAKFVQRRSIGGRTEAQKLADVLDFINTVIAEDPEFTNPITDEAKLMDTIQDGILLAKLLNYTIPDAVDLKTLIRTTPLSTYQKTENLRIALNGAIRIGCASESLTPHMILQGKSVLVISLICQLIRVKEVQKLNLTPELSVLASKGESVETIYYLPTDQIIIRWLNYHLQRTGSKRRVTNLSQDLQDGEVYILLFHQLAPHKCSLEGLRETDYNKRMEMVMDSTVNIGISHTFTITKLVEGSAWLHQVFCCVIFNTIHGLGETIRPLTVTNEFLRSLAQLLYFQL
eukprot:TRINITY_DN136567_c0_g1_i1.p1 TRINITY_DN136567_c0_g1~~TRINITY_DN136567_c0_g1_i1.p1  ORF type:complete len:369 (-),score=12.93 TRINITY_DN136567_c0_g1_i1:73-1113(-)